MVWSAIVVVIVSLALVVVVVVVVWNELGSVVKVVRNNPSGLAHVLDRLRDSRRA